MLRLYIFTNNFNNSNLVEAELKPSSKLECRSIYTRYAVFFLVRYYY
jgi:hypothetical protein